MIKVCQSCKNEFDADADWKKLCFDCWIESKEKGKVAELEREIFRLNAAIHQWQEVARGNFTLNADDTDRIQRLERRIDQLNTENNSLRMKLMVHKEQATSIPRDMWRRLIQLVHPDKHGNSESANEVTKWLLNNRS